MDRMRRNGRACLGPRAWARPVGFFGSRQNRHLPQTWQAAHCPALLPRPARSWTNDVAAASDLLLLHMINVTLFTHLDQIHYFKSHALAEAWIGAVQAIDLTR
jgi:hypothetical protein